MRWRDALVPGAGLLVLLASVLPWYGSRVRVISPGADRLEIQTASAWQASSRWSAAIVLCLVAAGTWLMVLVIRGRVPRWLSLALLLPVFGAGVLVGAQWTAIHDMDPTHAIDLSVVGAAPYPVQRDPGIGRVTRDHLFVYHAPDFTMDVWFGLYAGIAAMALLGAALVISGTEEAVSSAAVAPPPRPST